MQREEKKYLFDIQIALEKLKLLLVLLKYLKALSRI